MSLIDKTLREMEAVQKEINSIFNQVGYTSASRRTYPFVNLYENENELMLVAETPGMKKEELNISVTDNVLTLSGTCAEKNYGEKVRRLRNERCKGNFEKSFHLPLKIEKDKITASLTDGMLTLTMPKSEEAKPKKIMIEA